MELIMLEKIGATICGLNPLNAIGLLREGAKDAGSINSLVGGVMLAGQAITVGGIGILYLTSLIAQQVFKATPQNGALAQPSQHSTRDTTFKVLKGAGLVCLGVVGAAALGAGLYAAFLSGSLSGLGRIPTFGHKV
jgi:hypothetical protein